MNINFQPISSRKIIRQLGLGPGGRTQQKWTRLVQTHMLKYLPYRAVGSVEAAVNIGASDDFTQIVVRGDYMRYLYEGKVMAGKPKKAINKDLKYTKTKNALAGPFWDRRLKQNEMAIMVAEIIPEMMKEMGG